MPEFEIQSNGLFDQVRESSIDRRIQRVLVENPLGSIRYVSGEATLYSLADALARVHDLHLRAYGERPAIAVAAAIEPHVARSLFRVGVTALMVQAALLDKNLLSDYLSTIVEVAEQLGTTGGLESVFVTALMTMPKEANPQLLDALNRWNHVEYDGRPGGDHAFGVALSPDAGDVFRFVPDKIRNISQLSGRQSDARSLIQSHLDRYSLGREACIGVHELAYAGYGALIGGAAAGGPGAVVGAGLGISVGTAVGNIKCRDKDSSEDPDKDRPPKTGDNDAGCFADPYKDCYQNDPYSGFAISQGAVLLPKGDGLAALVMTVNGITKLNVRNTLRQLDFQLGLGPIVGDRGRVDIGPGGGHSVIGPKPRAVVQRVLLASNSDDVQETNRDLHPKLRVELDLAATVEVNYSYVPITGSDGTPTTDNRGNQMYASIPLSKTITFPEGSAGSLQFPNGLEVPLDFDTKNIRFFAGPSVVHPAPVLRNGIVDRGVRRGS